MKETVDSVNTKAFSEYQNFNDYDYAHFVWLRDDNVSA